MLFMYFRGVVGAVATFSSQDSAGLYSDLMQRKERYVHFLAAFGPPSSRRPRSEQPKVRSSGLGTCRKKISVVNPDLHPATTF